MPIEPVATSPGASALLDPSTRAAPTTGNNGLNNLATVYSLSEEEKIKIIANNPDGLLSLTLAQVGQAYGKDVAAAIERFADGNKLAKTDADGNALTVRQILEKAPEGIGLNTLRGIFDKQPDWVKALVLAPIVKKAWDEGGLAGVLKLADFNVPIARWPSGNLTAGVKDGVPTATVSQNLNPAGTSNVAVTGNQPINGRFGVQVAATFNLGGGLVLSGTHSTDGSWTAGLNQQIGSNALGVNASGGENGLQLAGTVSVPPVVFELSTANGGQFTAKLPLIITP